MRALVTGGAGFIGSALVDRLLAHLHRVEVVDNLSRGRRSNLARAEGSFRFSFHDADLRDPGAGRLISRLRPDVIFHLAAQSDANASVIDPIGDAETNVLGGLRVLEAARHVGAKFVFASSGGAVHGGLLPGEPAAAEDAPQRPATPYGLAKRTMVDCLTLYQQLYGLEWAAVAPANVYGPRQDPTGEGGVVAIFAERLLTGAECVIYGQGTQTRDFVYVDDVVEAFLQAAEAGAGVYNIGTGVETSIVELYELVATHCGVSAASRHAPPRLGDVERSVLDAAKARQQLGWTPRIGLAQGLDLTISSMRA